MAKVKTYSKKISANSLAKVKKSSGGSLADGTAKPISAGSLVGSSFNPDTDWMNEDQKHDLSFAKAIGEVNDSFVERQFNRELDASNTAHQREVADLKAAGLNPVLSAGGSGASSPSVGSAESGEGYATARQQMRVQKRMNDAQVKASRYSTDKNYSLGTKNIALNKWLAKYNGEISDLVSARQLEGQRVNAQAIEDSAWLNYKASVDTANITKDTQLSLANINKELQEYLNDHPNTIRGSVVKYFQNGTSENGKLKKMLKIIDVAGGKGNMSRYTVQDAIDFLNGKYTEKQFRNLHNNGKF